MTTIEMLRPYVAQKVAELLGIEKVKVDPDGDIPIRAGSAVSFARLLDGPTGPLFRVFSPFLLEVKQSPKLLDKLNELNTASPYVRFFWIQDTVYCSTDMKADTLEPEEIQNAIGAVGWHADNFDDLLKGEFGGHRMIEDEELPKPAGKDSTYL